MKQNSFDEQKMMQEMGALMREAMETPDGMRALAAAIAPPIEQTIAARSITPLLLTEHRLPPGESAKYQLKPEVKAYYIAMNGDAVECPLNQEEMEASLSRVVSNPMVDTSVLRNGNIGSLADIQKAAGDEIRKQIDARTLSLISAAVPEDNVCECTGGDLTEDALGEAMGVIEDMELAVKYLVMRGAHGRILKGLDLDPQTKRELNQKGIFKVYNGAEIIYSSSMPSDEVLVIPDEEIGKYPIREKLTAEPVSVPQRFKTGWVVWTEIGQVVTRANLIAKIKITA